MKRKTTAYDWWRRGLDDGAQCLRRRNPHFFEQYKEAAIEALEPGEREGVCAYIYTRAFRVGYDSERVRREQAGIYWKRPKKSGSLDK